MHMPESIQNNDPLQRSHAGPSVRHNIFALLCYRENSNFERHDISTHNSAICNLQASLSIERFKELQHCSSPSFSQLRKHILQQSKMTRKIGKLAVFVGLFLECCSLSLSSFSSFHGAALHIHENNAIRESPTTATSGAASLEMRKQKASDRRTRRLQRGDFEYAQELARSTAGTMTESPMSGKAWRHKQTHSMQPTKSKTAGRARGRKRSALYNSLSLYHNKFLNLLTEEYRQEVRLKNVFYWNHDEKILV